MTWKCGRERGDGEMDEDDEYRARTRRDVNNGISRDAAESAVRTLLQWAGDDPKREGLRDTPKRVVDAYGDWFSGYSSDPAEYLLRTFEEVEGYDEMVILRDISFESFCEHHMAPIIGRAHVGYLPTDRVVGISKLARVVDGYARRFQVQEKLTAQVARCISETLKPRGVGVVIDAIHQCMTTRGVHKRGVSMVTSKHAGDFSYRPQHPRGVSALHRHRGQPTPLMPAVHAASDMGANAIARRQAPGARRRAITQPGLAGGYSQSSHQALRRADGAPRSSRCPPNV